MNGQVNIFVPIDIEGSISKSNDNPTEKSWYVRGYATTPDIDFQEDMIDPEGIDISHFLEHGYINYEHQQGNEYKIGAPTKNSYVDIKKGLFVEGKLYKGNPHAASIWNLANNIAKSGVERQLGFSIEGFARERDKEDPRKITKTYITNVALTTNPANPNATWETFMKSYMAGYGITPETQTNAGALRAESFARSLHNLSYSYKKLQDPVEFKQIWNDVGDYLDALDKYSPESAVMFLQLAKGLSREDAVSKIDKMMNKK